MSTAIIYGTVYGYTEKCAKVMEEKIVGGTELINIKEEKKIDLSKYDTVIIGGSIYMGQIQKGIKEFCSRNIDELKHKKLGFFVCCGSPESMNKYVEQSFPKELVDNAKSIQCLGGEMNIESMKFFHKIIMKMVSKVKEKQGEKIEAIALTGNIEILANEVNK